MAKNTAAAQQGADQNTPTDADNGGGEQTSGDAGSNTSEQGGEGQGGDAGQQPAVETVRMTRDADVWDAPHEADVHPDEVDAYATHGGWVRA